eukprot:283801-Hanusia_phi.AAC.2
MFPDAFTPDEYLKSVIPRNHAEIYGWTGTVLPAGMAYSVRVHLLFGATGSRQNVMDEVLLFTFSENLLEQTKRLSCGCTAQLNMDIHHLRKYLEGTSPAEA